jgi:hypothetical protein
MFDCNPVAIAAGFLNVCNSNSFLLIMFIIGKDKFQDSFIPGIAAFIMQSGGIILLCPFLQ